MNNIDVQANPHAFTTEEGREWLKGVLRMTDQVTIVFTKVDGTERTMRCTLKEEIVVPYEKKTDRVRAENTDTLRVWDLEKNEWRGFRLDSIRQVAFDL